ncbi:hypothetical protein [Nocardioides pacificus]
MTDTPNLDGPPSPYVEKDASWRDGLGGEVFNVEVEDMPRWQCLLTIVEDPQERYDLSTFRVKRSGGATPGDHQYRQNVFVLVGAITVAAGHIEAEMKRIIVVAEESESAGFADVPSTWSGLVDRLTAIADGDGMLAEPLRAVLDWGAEQKVAEIRHAAVHSAWWVFDAGHVHRSRFKNKSNGSTQMGTWEQVAQQSETLFEYLDRLQTIVPWPMATLPPIDPDEQVVPDLRLEFHDGPRRRES